MAEAPSLRNASGDVLGLRRAGGGALAVAVGAMAFVATLAIAGEGAARVAAGRLLAETAPSRTALIPRPEEKLAGTTRIAAALTALRADPAVAEARPLPLAEVGELVRPWLGPDSGKLGGLELPAVIAVTLRPELPAGDPADRIGRALSQVVAGAVLADQDAQLGDLSRVLLVVRGLALAVVLAVATATTLVVGVATRALVLRRGETLGVAHGLGAEDGWIAARFARLGARHAATGAIGGAALAMLPVTALVWLLPPLLGAPPVGWDHLGDALPRATWIGFAAVPVFTTAVGYVVAARVARGWLGRLA